MNLPLEENSLFASVINTRKFSSFQQTPYIVREGRGLRSPAELCWYSFPDSIARLNDLHMISKGADSSLSLAEPLTQEDAQALYRVAATSIMAQISTTPEQLIPKFLAQFMDKANAIGTTGGLEPVFSTALLALPNNAELSIAEMIGRWTDMEQDEVPGASHRYSIGFDSRTLGFLKFDPSILSDLKTLDVKTTSDLRSRLSVRMESYSATREQCIGFLGLVGSITGGAVGGVATAPGGPIAISAGVFAGVGAGDTIGKNLGSVICKEPSDKSDGNTGDDDEGEDVEESPDDEPELETASTPEGCVTQWEDFNRKDPYRSFASNVEKAFIPSSRSLAIYVRQDSGISKIQSLPANKISISSKTLNGDFQNHENVLEKIKDRNIKQNINIRGQRKLESFDQSEETNDSSSRQTKNIKIDSVPDPRKKNEMGFGFSIVSDDDENSNDDSPASGGVGEQGEGNQEQETSKSAKVVFPEGTFLAGVYPNGMKIPNSGNIPLWVFKELAKINQVADPAQNLKSGNLRTSIISRS